MSLQLRYCRFCAEHKAEAEITDLLKEYEIRESVIEKVTACKISSIDFSIKNLPETICSSCLTSLNAFNDFLKQVKESQIILNDRCKLNNTEQNRSTKNIYESCYSNVDNETSLKQDRSINSAKEFDYNVSTELVNCTLKDNFNNSTTDNKKHISDGNIMTTYPCKHCHISPDSLERVSQHCREVYGVCNSLKYDCDEFQSKFGLFLGHVNQHKHSMNELFTLYDIHVGNGSGRRHCTRCNCASVYCGEVVSDKVCIECNPNECHGELKNVTSEISKKEISKLKKLPYHVVHEANSIETWREYPWICQYCDTTFADRDVLWSHVKDVHQKCFGYKCIDCPKASKDFNSFVKHVREHRPNLTYHCEFCNFQLKDAQTDLNHLDEHLLNDYLCKSCGYIFNNEVELQKHVSLYNQPKKIRTTSKHRLTVNNNGLTCKICHKTYKNLTALQAHRKLHTDRRRDFTCDRCGRAFFTKGALSAHCLLHVKQEPQTCLICKKSFLTLTRLKKHLRTHNASKPFQCLECHRSFRLKEQLKGHLVTHTNLVPYKCQHCEKAFKHKNVLKIHQNQHTGARPYSCDLCKMDFSNWSNCDKHMKRKHGATLAETVMTPQGKLPLNPNTGKPRKMADSDTVKQWALQIMEPCKRGKKTTNRATTA